MIVIIFLALVWVLSMFIPFSFYHNLQGRCYYCPHFMGEKMGSWRIELFQGREYKGWVSNEMWLLTSSFKSCAVLSFWLWWHWDVVTKVGLWLLFFFFFMCFLLKYSWFTILVFALKFISSADYSHSDVHDFGLLISLFRFFVHLQLSMAGGYHEHNWGRKGGKKSL